MRIPVKQNFILKQSSANHQIKIRDRQLRIKNTFDLWKHSDDP